MANPLAPGASALLPKAGREEIEIESHLKLASSAVLHSMATALDFLAIFSLRPGVSSV